MILIFGLATYYSDSFLNTYTATHCNTLQHIAAHSCDVPTYYTPQGFLFATVTASQFLHNGGHKTALVVGADALTRWVDWTDRSVYLSLCDCVCALARAHVREYVCVGVCLCTCVPVCLCACVHAYVCAWNGT